MSDSDRTNAARLHSKYQPQQEADRFIKALNLNNDIDCFILIEPGLGYLVSALQKIMPGKEIIVLHADSYFRKFKKADVPSWYPDSGIGVQEFLEKSIDDCAKVRVIEWRPSLREYGESCLMLARECIEFIKRIEAGRRTTSAFGVRWTRNFFRNMAILQNTLLYKTMDTPVVITGSGPSLETAIPLLAALRENVFILAASSSLAALAAGGVVPDMVIATDGGGWALLHLYACFRGQAGGPKLAVSLSAALPSRCAALQLLPFSDGSLWQNIALRAAGIPSAHVPQRGTVTASALELALLLSGGKIFLAGMDLGVRDIVSHARPYGFDHLFFGAASRLRPVYSQYFARSGDIKAGGSYDVYAAWFKNRLESLRGRVMLLASPLASPFNEKILTAAGEKKDFFAKITLNGTPADRCKRAAGTLITALENPQYAEVLAAELSPLLFPSQKDVSIREIADTVYEIGRKYWDKSRGQK
jgi:hypothetical protein